MMGDQKFDCGRYKGRTFEEIAKSDLDFCEKVLKSSVCNKYYPEDFKKYLLSRRRTTICENNVTSFLKKWDESIEAEFRQIIGSPEIAIKEVHPQAAGYPNGNLGVFIRYFFKKCIFNQQNTNATNYNIEMFASIFPFKVSRAVVQSRLPVRQLFDAEFYAGVEEFLERHFEERYDSAIELVDLFLRNVYDFRMKHFDAAAVRKLKNVVKDAVDAERSSFTTTFVNDYLRQFPRLNKDGVTRYTELRRMYNNLCAALGREDVGEQRRRQIRMLPEINSLELLELLEPKLFASERATYVQRFHRYLFFFVYAIESADDNPLFFIDDPLYECLKGYAEFRRSREAPENLQSCLWLMTLIHRRNQELDYRRCGNSFEADSSNLLNIREYVENFPNIKSAIVDFELPTSLIRLGIPIVVKDTILNVFYSRAEKSNLMDFFEGIIRAHMCPLDIKKVVMYNAYSGVETSLVVPPCKKEVLQFVHRYNKYDPARQIPVESAFTDGLEEFFEMPTIQWDSKYPRKFNSLPVYEYKEVSDA